MTETHRSGARVPGNLHIIVGGGRPIAPNVFLGIFDFKKSGSISLFLLRFVGVLQRVIATHKTAPVVQIRRV